MMDALCTVRLVARLSSRCWTEVEKIFHLYEGGNIKGQRKVKEQGARKRIAELFGLTLHTS